VVDVNRVFTPPGATWGNVARFPGAVGGYDVRTKWTNISCWRIC